jgi:hypothetical protein
MLIIIVIDSKEQRGYIDVILGVIFLRPTNHTPTIKLMPTHSRNTHDISFSIFFATSSNQIKKSQGREQRQVGGQFGPPTRAPTDRPAAAGCPAPHAACTAGGQRRDVDVRAASPPASDGHRHLFFPSDGQECPTRRLAVAGEGGRHPPTSTKRTRVVYPCM